MKIKEINLKNFKDLKYVLENKQRFRFTISDHRDERFREVKNYRVVNDDFKGKYEYSNYVSIDIYNDHVKLHCNGDGAINPVYRFNQNELNKLQNMNDMEFLEECIIKAIYKWNNYFD